MSLETDDLKQTALLWAASGYDDDGEPKVNNLVAMFVRWEDGRGTTQDGQGDTVVFTATVYVDRVIAVESVLYLGTETEYNADTKQELYRVVGRSATPDIKNQSYRRSVLLARLSRELPGIN